MSAEINNREYRKKVLKDLIAQLHAGKTADEVKERFAETFHNVSAAEISEAESALISEGLAVEEVQRLCDVHAAVFEGSIEEIHSVQTDPSDLPGHPAHTLKQENRALERLMARRLEPLLAKVGTEPEGALRQALSGAFEELWQIDAHYSRKENLFFPYLEQYGIYGPPKVMWGVDDEVRNELRALRKDLQRADVDLSNLKTKAAGTLEKIKSMISKEENILLPMMVQTLATEEWEIIAAQSSEIGYCLIVDVPAWVPDKKNISLPDKPEIKPASGKINLPTGVFELSELTHFLNTLPIDITFVDKNDTVKYFSQTSERIFARTTAIIGRKVSNCHPPASVKVVEGIVEDLKSGKKDHEDFWIKMGPKYVLIRYYAVRDEHGEYLGTLEVTQDIAPLQAITGEKRLVSDG